MAAKKQVKVKATSKITGLKRKSSPSLNSGNLLEYFRAGESYTSLVLGIIVVIIASVLLLSLFKTRPDNQKGTTSISTVVNQSANVTPSPTNTSQNQMEGFVSKDKKTYTIGYGDNLWTIAVKVYGDGYKWVDIAKANNLIANPGVINVGNKLSLPEQKASPVAKVVTPTPTVKAIQPTQAPSQDQAVKKITGSTYVTVSGDNLWGVALRAYGDGYKWVDLAKANNLTDPNLIFSGNTLKIPR